MYFPKDGWSFTFDLDGVEINGKILNEIIGAKKPDNNAPKNIKGEYDLSIHGNTIVLVDNVDGTTVEAKCHPDDDFDIGTGIKEAFKKLNEKREEKKIKVGDWVEVVDSGHSYSTYPEWLYNKVGFETLKNYAYGYRAPNGRIGQVIVIDTHENDKTKKMMGIEANGKIYIIGVEGVKKAAKPQ